MDLDDQLLDTTDTAIHPPRGKSRRPSTFAQQLATSTRNHGRQDARAPIINDLSGVGSVEKRYAVTAKSIDRAHRRQSKYYCHTYTDSFGNYEGC